MKKYNIIFTFNKIEMLNNSPRFVLYNKYWFKFTFSLSNKINVGIFKSVGHYNNFRYEIFDIT